MSYDDRFEFEANLAQVTYLDQVYEVLLTTIDRVVTGLSVWQRQELIADRNRGQGAETSIRIRLNVMVEDPDSDDAVDRVRSALNLDDDTRVPV